MINDAELLQAGFRYAMSLCHDRSDAKDLVQDAWLRVVRYPVVSRGLLITAVRHAFIDGRRRLRLVKLDGGVERAPAPAADRRGHQDELTVALGDLRQEEREAIFLSVVEGYTAQEIADLSGQSRNTVLSLIRRGKAKLRERLDEEEAEPLAMAEEGGS